jgi:hypothetical protein
MRGLRAMVMGKLHFGLVVLLLLLVGVSAGCAAKQTTLEDAFPREGVSDARVYFVSMEGYVTHLERGGREYNALLDALYGAPPAEQLPESYSPELQCTHRVVLSSEAGDLTLYYDDELGTFFHAGYVKTKREGDIKTYYAFAAQMADEMNAFAAIASVPAKPVDEPPLAIDPLLRADVDLQELVKPGQAIDYETFTYAYQEDTPLYAVLTHEDQVPGLQNGYLLFVAASGMKPTDGYLIDIGSIEENDSYYVVKVWHDAPVEGAEVSDQPTYPAVAVKVDARRVMAKKIVVFINEKDEILSLTRISRDFLDNLPTPMPPLATPEPYEGDEGEE